MPLPHEPRFTIAATPEQVLLVASLYWALSANQPFFHAALSDRPLLAPATWGFLAALGVALVALHVLLLGAISPRPLLKPLLAVLVVATALASWFMQCYGICLDPAMLRNVLRTDPAESRELLSWTLLLHMAVFAGLPLALLWRVRLARRSWRRALLWRTATLAAAALVGAAARCSRPATTTCSTH